MVVATIEVWPEGNSSKKRSVVRLDIWNAGGDERFGDYCFRAEDDAGVATGEIKSFDRGRGAAQLVTHALLMLEKR